MPGRSGRPREPGGYARFEVVDAAFAVIGAMSLFWSIAVFVVATITLAMILIIAFPKS